MKARHLAGSDGRLHLFEPQKETKWVHFVVLFWGSQLDHETLEVQFGHLRCSRSFTLQPDCPLIACGRIDLDHSLHNPAHITGSFLSKCRLHQGTLEADLVVLALCKNLTSADSRAQRKDKKADADFAKAAKAESHSGWPFSAAVRKIAWASSSYLVQPMSVFTCTALCPCPCHPCEKKKTDELAWYPGAWGFTVAFKSKPPTRSLPPSS